MPSTRRSTRLANIPSKSYAEALTESSDEAEVESSDDETTATRGGQDKPVAGVAPPVRRSKRNRTRAKGRQRKRKDDSHDSLLDLENMTIPKVTTKRSNAKDDTSLNKTDDADNRKRTAISTRQVKDSQQNKRKKTNSAKSSTIPFALPNKVDDDDAPLEILAPIDKANAGNVLHVPEYATSIYQHLYSIEVSLLRCDEQGL